MLSNGLFFDLASLWIGLLDTVAFSSRAVWCGDVVVVKRRATLPDTYRCRLASRGLPGWQNQPVELGGGCDCRKIKWTDSPGLQER